MLALAHSNFPSVLCSLRKRRGHALQLEVVGNIAGCVSTDTPKQNCTLLVREQSRLDRQGSQQLLDTLHGSTGLLVRRCRRRAAPPGALVSAGVTMTRQVAVQCTT